MADYVADITIKKQKPGRIAYLNVRLLDPATNLDAHGGVLTEGETITAVGDDVTADNLGDDVERIDCQGHCLAPGLVDIRAHFREPGFEHKETIATGSRSAAVGGITTAVCMPSTEPPIDDVSLVHFIERRARETAIIKVHPIAALTKGRRGKQLTEMGLLREAGAIAFSDGMNTVMDAMVLRRALSYSTIFNALVMHHAEDLNLTATGQMNEGETSSRLGLSGMPAESEAIVAARDVRLAEMTGGRLHLAHLTTAESIDIVRRAKARGLKITCDTAPHYFALNETAIGDYRTFAKVRPPLRAEPDRQAVVAGLKDGTIDAIVSDHAPHDQDSKRQPFAQAAFGIVGLETLLPLTLELVHNRHLDILEALALATCRPADLIGLNAGHLSIGRPADLVIFDLDRPWQIDRRAFQSKSKNSPFDERPVQGRALRTVMNGHTVFMLGGSED